MKTSGFLRNTLIYWAGRMGARSASFLLLPVLTRFIAPPEWGRFNLLVISGDLAALAVSCQLPAALYRYWAFAETDAERRRLSGAALAAPLAVGSILFLPVYLWPGPVASALGLPGWGNALRVLLLSQQLAVAQMVVQAEMRLRDETRRYAFTEIAQNLGQAALSILFVAAFGWGVMGLLWAQLGAFIAISVVLVPRFLARTRLNLDPALLRRLVPFALPLVPSALAMAGVHNVDRFFLESMRGPTEVGVYSVGYKLGMVVNILLLGPFLLIWEPKSYEIARAPDAGRQIGRIFSWFVAIAMFLVLGLSGAAKEIVTVMAGPGYELAYTVVPLVAVSYALFGFDAIARLGLLVQRRTRTVLTAVAIACLLNVVGNLVLIPRLGIAGAGWATLIAFAALFGLDLVLARRELAIVWEWPRLLAVAVAFGLGMTAVSLVRGVGLWTAIAIKLALLALYPLILLALGFFRRGTGQAVPTPRTDP